MNYRDYIQTIESPKYCSPIIHPATAALAPKYSSIWTNMIPMDFIPPITKKVFMKQPAKIRRMLHLIEVSVTPVATQLDQDYGSILLTYQNEPCPTSVYWLSTHLDSRE